jgi:exopolyphosphatase/guanosine-5'-triphosphate,3'-diphosphate pyrophosphatase
MNPNTPLNTINDGPRHIAAIDIGSNSFHLVIARVIDANLQIVSRHKQRVQLAAGLDLHNNLNQSAMNRGLDCLRLFAERLQNFPIEDVRVAATFTLRQANNAHLFLKRAAQIFPYPIEIIPGTEEARLIYLGVSHTQPNEGKTLVMDIGGGSTELILGENFDTHLLYSKQMGCVSYTERFFAHGHLSLDAINAAQLAAEQKLENIAHLYQKKGWDCALGSSGTIKTLREMLIQQGYNDGIFTYERLLALKTQILTFKDSASLNINGLTDDRKPLISAGLAILMGLFNTLKIKEMRFSRGALREGLLYEMEDSCRANNIRIRTANALAQQYHVDTEHATRIQETAEVFYRKLPQFNDNKQSERLDLLHWASTLHEVGLSINYSGYHRHSAYILQNNSMPGFNMDQQTVLASLVRFHRKSLKLQEIPEINLFKNKHLYPMIRCLRLAVLLHGQRQSEPLPNLTIQANREHWHLIFPMDWHISNRLLIADLQKEQEYWYKSGWLLTIEST